MEVTTVFKESLSFSSVYGAIKLVINNKQPVFFLNPQIYQLKIVLLNNFKVKKEIIIKISKCLIRLFLIKY